MSSHGRSSSHHRRSSSHHSSHSSSRHSSSSRSHDYDRDGDRRSRSRYEGSSSSSRSKRRRNDDDGRRGSSHHRHYSDAAVAAAQPPVGLPQPGHIKRSSSSLLQGRDVAELLRKAKAKERASSPATHSAAAAAAASRGNGSDTGTTATASAQSNSGHRSKTGRSKWDSDGSSSSGGEAEGNGRRRGDSKSRRLKHNRKRQRREEAEDGEIVEQPRSGGAGGGAGATAVPTAQSARPARGGKDRWASDSSDDDAAARHQGAAPPATAAAAAPARTTAAVDVAVRDGRDEHNGTLEGAVATGPDQPEPAHSNGEGDGALEGKPGDVANGDDSKASSSSGMVEKPADDKPRHVPLWMGCRSVEVYERLATINEGTFGVVFRARDTQSGELVAVKQVKMKDDAGEEGFPITALRETNVLLSLQHPNIIRVREMVVGSSLDQVFMVMDYMPHDFRQLMTRMKDPWKQSEVKCLVQQLLRGVEYFHRHWYVHRDLKPANLLLAPDGRLVVCDFGLARKYGEPLRPMTPGIHVVTLAYRSPELLLDVTVYSPAVDMWSVGCIMAEFLKLKPIVRGTNEMEQLQKIFQLVGAPTEQTWPGFKKLPGAKRFAWKKWKPGQMRKHLNLPANSFGGTGAYLTECGMDLLRRMLTPNPDTRITAAKALKHPWFTEAPLPVTASEMPKYVTGS